jgi:hypothetical protein
MRKMNGVAGVEFTCVFLNREEHEKVLLLNESVDYVSIKMGLVAA